MDFNQIISGLDLTSADLSRALKVSDGHIADLKSGRRKVSLTMAARLEDLTKRRDLVARVAAEKARPE
jgi:plasmid maintenance system antidote protein VapI